MSTPKSKSNARRTRRRSQSSVKRPAASKSSVRRKGRSTQHGAAAARRISALKLGTPTPIIVRPTIAKATQSLIVTGGAVPEVQTVIYVHGIGNKPGRPCSSVNGTRRSSVQSWAIAAGWLTGSTANTTRFRRAIPAVTVMLSAWKTTRRLRGQ